MIEKLLLKLRARDDVAPEEEEALRGLVQGTREVAADRVVIREGELLDSSVLLLEGLMCRYRDMRNGARQISELQIPGDFLDLHGFTLKKLDHHVMSLTPARMAIVPHDRLRAVTESHPHLTRLLWMSTNIDAAVHREWMLSIGRRPALARLAHLFCELHFRFDVVGMTNGGSYPLSLTQADIAECLGLTPIHVNRTLMELRQTGAIEFRSRRVTIHDLDRLMRLAEFDPIYLHLEKRPR